jgi:hypothetical protein
MFHHKFPHNDVRVFSKVAILIVTLFVIIFKLRKAYINLSVVTKILLTSSNFLEEEFQQIGNSKQKDHQNHDHDKEHLTAQAQ